MIDQLVKEASKYSLQELHRITELARQSAILLHEISNPLTSAFICLERCGNKSPAIMEARQSIQLMRDYVEAARQHVRTESQLVDFDLTSQIKQLKHVLMPLAKKGGVRLIFSPIPDHKLYGDPVKFRQILANLIVNAIEAYPETIVKTIKAVRITISVKAHDLLIEVRDRGQGISTERMQLLFTPFYSTKAKSGQGLGIGLSIVKKYVTNDFNGSVEVTSSVGKGSTFLIKLPLKKT